MCTHSWYSLISITWSRIWNMGHDEIRVTHMKYRRHVSLNKCAQMSKNCQRQTTYKIMSMKLHCEAYYKYLISALFICCLLQVSVHLVVVAYFNLPVRNLTNLRWRKAFESLGTLLSLPLQQGNAACFYLTYIPPRCCRWGNKLSCKV